jgi:hypothetical protein
MAKTTRKHEAAQQAADVYIGLAQALEAQAKRYRETAKYYRSGDLDVAYKNLPADAGDHMRHPVQRAIDGISIWNLREAYEQSEAELKAIR